MEEQPIAYTAIAKDSDVLSVQGNLVGHVEHVLQVAELDLFDGIVVKTEAGIRFVDRDQVDHITSKATYLTLSDIQADLLPLPDGAPAYETDALQDDGDSLTAFFGRLFRRQHWVKDDD